MNSPSPKNSAKSKYGPLRPLMPFVCLIAGVGLIIKGGLSMSTASGPTFLYWGIGLTILGVVAGAVTLWMAKRGL